VKGAIGVLLAGATWFTSACSAPPRPPALRSELTRTAAQAQELFARGELRRARAQFGLALELARLMDDPLEIGNGSYNLALVEADAGEFARARELLAEAEAALLRAGESPVDVHLLRAHLAVHAGDLAAADAALAELTAAGEGAPAQLALLRGALASARGEREATVAALQAAAAALGESAERPTSPELLELAARAQQFAGQPRAAAQLRDQQADALRADRRFRRMAQALSDAAQAYTDAGEFTAAADRALRAAQSHLAADALDAARADAQLAARAAERTADPQLRDRVVAMQRAIPPPLTAPPGAR
jgi:hypothetical protein